MTTTEKKVEIEQVSCEICLKEVPLEDVFNPETADYVVHFCGLDCYEEWKSQQSEVEIVEKNLLLDATA